MNGRLFLLAGIALGATSLVAILPQRSEAVQTRTVVIDSIGDFAGGTLDRTALTSDGSVALGQDVTRVALDPAATGVWSLLEAGGALYAGTANDGRVYRVANGRAEHWANTPGVAVTAMVAGDDDRTIFASVAGSGVIVKLRGPEGGRPREGERWATLPGVEHVWAMVYDRARRTLFAATGPDGKLFAVDAQGRATVVFDAEESNLYALAAGPNGLVYAGTGGTTAIVYAVRGPGDARAIARFAGTEVKRIVPVGELLYVAVNEFSDGVFTPSRTVGQSRGPTAGGTGGTRARPGRGTLHLVRANGVVERVYQNGETHLAALEWDSARREAVVGLGANGRVVAIAEDRTARIAYDVDETTVLSLSLTGRTRAFATGDTGAVYLVGDGAPQRASWTSRVLDAGNPARWGAVRWRGTGALDWEFRWGNSEPADGTWSAWAPLREDGTVGDVSARYLQVRARWSRDPATVLRAVTVYYLPTNQRPVVTEVTAESRAGDVRPPVVRLNWKVENPDSDAIRYRVRFRGDGEGGWRSLLRNSDYTTATSLEWNVEGLPEGFYRVRVEASDEASNPEGEALDDRRESEPVLVDMTPPTVSVRVEGGRVLGEARDGASAITRVELSYDTLEWRPARPGDGVFDEREERFEARAATGLSRGEHTLAVRAWDEAGNMGTGSVTVRIP